LRVSICAPEALPPLPAAVEVAAYRIALEAFTNVVRHAQASACYITLTLTQGALDLVVADNGLGLSTEARAGVGFASMHERAAELGGDCVIEPGEEGGVQVKARLPFITDES
jgi:signal transduction histidine kinase